MFFLLRSAFWIVAISFLLNGGRLPTAITEHVPVSAHESAAQVIGAIESLHGYCDRHERLCGIAGDSFAFVRGQLVAATNSLTKALDKPPKG